MKKSLAHLPEPRKAELREIVRAIRAVAEVEMIILFGSYARGDYRAESWVIKGGRYEYYSDYDILVVVADRRRLWGGKLSGGIFDAVQSTGKVRIPLGLMTVDIEKLNQELSDGDCFYSDLKREGIELYNTKAFRLARARTLKPAERRAFAEQDFKETYETSRVFFTHYKFGFDKKHYKIAAFHLHQTVENLYATLLKVFTRDRDRSHSLVRLGRLAARQAPDVLGVFPEVTKQEKECYRLLRRAYVDARYKPEYKITRKQLEYLEARVKKLRMLVRKICKAKIESFQ